MKKKIYEPRKVFGKTVWPNLPPFGKSSEKKGGRIVNNKNRRKEKR